MRLRKPGKYIIWMDSLDSTRELSLLLATGVIVTVEVPRRFAILVLGADDLGMGGLEMRVAVGNNNLLVAFVDGAFCASVEFLH
jgi:hypothetical protein